MFGGSRREDAVGRAPDSLGLGWAGTRPFGQAEAGRLRQVARFVAAPLAALAARAALAALLEAYLGRRSAARVQAGAAQRGTGETIRAALLSADLRDFTALSEATEPAAVIAALDAWFDRIAGAVHAFGGEVLKFIGDGVLAIFPVTGAPAEACEAALCAVVVARAGMAHLATEGRSALGGQRLFPNCSARDTANPNAETVKVMDEASTDGSFTIAQTNGQGRRDTRQDCRQENGAVGADTRHCKQKGRQN
jgi:Adenylate and Guanylate cyclase catalytic domain